MSVPDYPLGAVLDFKFTSRAFDSGIPFTLAGTPTVEVFKDNNTTEVQTGISPTVDFDGVTGLNNVRITASEANGYAIGESYQIVIEAGTVDGDSVVGEVVAQFSIERGGMIPRLDRNADLTESQRGAHTWQGNVYYVAPTNGVNAANRGTRELPLATIQYAIDNYVDDSNHDVIILVSDAPAGATTHSSGAATTTIDKRYVFIRGPGRDFICTRTGDGDTFTIEADGVELSGVQISTASGAASGNSVAVDAADFAKITRCWFPDSADDAIDVNVGSNYVITHNVVTNCGKGIHVNSGGVSVKPEIKIPVQQKMSDLLFG